MSAKTLSTAASDAIKAVQTTQGTNEAVKDTLITEIVSIYQTHPDVTPEHLILGDFSRGFIGRAYAGWYVHKAGVKAVDMNVTFIANNHSTIIVQDTPEAMTAEFARVASDLRATKRAVADADALSGKALNEALTEASAYLDEVSKKVLVPSMANDALIMTLRAKIATLTANYNAVIKAQQVETKNLVTN
jgi:hypothetical protein